ncbi:MAG: YceI family protein [Roseibacillus sp.]|jgi:polyisoprenoid-binding protein YceI
MKSTLLLIPLALTAALLVSCNNPADETTDAEVEEAKEKNLAVGPAGSAKYVFTGNSTIGFVGSKVTGSHSGGFKKFTGHFTLKDGVPVGNDHKVDIDMTSIWADNDRLAGHLKSADFFDVEKFPTAVFDITKIEKQSGTSYTVTGNLTLHGVTKSVTFPATVSHSDDIAKIEAKFDINRFDWDISFPGKKDDLIRKEVILEFKLEAKTE